MQMQFPIGFIIILYSLWSFYFFNHKARMRKEERKERLFAARQNYLEGLLIGGCPHPPKE